MKPVVLIISCARDQLAPQMMATRTWLSLAPVDHRFVIGRGSKQPQGENEIYVDAADDYWGLADKQREAYKWALEAGFDCAFVACVDTYVALPRLFASDVMKYDYVGRLCAEGPGYAGGGAGYWLGPPALLALADIIPHSDYPDRADGFDLANHGIRVRPDDRMWSTSYGSLPFDVWDKDIISVHLSRGTGVYDPLWMFECHQKYLEFCQ